jgi:hypothetical protein
MNVYTDPKLLEVAGAVESLPALPPTDGTEGDAASMVATGTDGIPLSEGVRQFTPGFAPTPYKPVTLGTILDRNSESPTDVDDAVTLAVSPCPSVKNKPLPGKSNGLREGG